MAEEELPEDDVDEDEDGLEVDVDDEDLDADLDDEDLVLDDDDLDLELDDEVLVEDEEDEGDDEPDEPPAKKRAKDDDDEDDDDELDPDDVEADLDKILKDRIAANDDEDEDEDDEDGDVVTKLESPDGVHARQEGELHCPSCFLLVSASLVARTGECPHCGEPM